MGGQAKTRMNVGDSCWVVVDDVNHPTGRFQAIVEMIEPRGTGGFEYFECAARIRDTRAGQRDGTLPGLNYRIYPMTQDFTELLNLIDILRMESKMRQEGDHIRIETLKDVIAATVRKSWCGCVRLVAPSGLEASRIVIHPFVGTAHIPEQRSALRDCPNCHGTGMP
jgi:hypothetical protein